MPQRGGRISARHGDRGVSKVQPSGIVEVGRQPWHRRLKAGDTVKEMYPEVGDIPRGCKELVEPSEDVASQAAGLPNLWFVLPDAGVISRRPGQPRWP